MVWKFSANCTEKEPFYCFTNSKNLINHQLTYNCCSENATDYTKTRKCKKKMVILAQWDLFFDIWSMNINSRGLFQRLFESVTKADQNFVRMMVFCL